MQSFGSHRAVSHFEVNLTPHTRVIATATAFGSEDVRKAKVWGAGRDYGSARRFLRKRAFDAKIFAKFVICKVLCTIKVVISTGYTRF